MNPHVHASDETLMRIAAGTLAPAPTIVVKAHLAQCPACRAKVSRYESVGGGLLDELDPTALAPDALGRLRARIDAGDRSTALATSPPPLQIDGIALPDSLRGCEIGAWRWVGPGRRMSKVTVPHEPDTNLILLKVGPGLALPDHGHVGKEYTYLVAGSYTDRFGQFKAGDLAEMGEEVEHQPIVDRDGECICLAALEGKMRFNGFFGRLLQPFVGI